MESIASYYQYNFVSVQPIFALIKEELRSYFDTGSVDDAVWSIYVNKCLRKLGRGSYPIKNTVLDMCSFTSDLPDKFLSVREAWLVNNTEEYLTQPSAVYEQLNASLLLTELDTYCSPSQGCTAPDVVQVMYRTTNAVKRSYQKKYLLKPANLNAVNLCASDSININCKSPASFDIRDNHFITDFREGNVYLVYYANEYDDDGYQLIPDNYRIQEFIEAFIKQKVFEQLSNSTIDETANQIERKATQYKQMADEAYIIADVECKKQNIYQKVRAIHKTQNSLNKYRIP